MVTFGRAIQVAKDTRFRLSGHFLSYSRQEYRMCSVDGLSPMLCEITILLPHFGCDALMLRREPAAVVGRQRRQKQMERNQLVALQAIVAGT